MQSRLFECLATQPKSIDGGNHDNESSADVYECMTSQDAEVGAEAVVMVTHSTIPEVKKRDCILEIDRKSTATMTSRDLQKALSPEKSHLLRIQRDSKVKSRAFCAPTKLECPQNDLPASIGSSVSIDNAIIAKNKRLNQLRMILSRSQVNGIYRLDSTPTSPLSNQQQQSPSNQQPSGSNCFFVTRQQHFVFIETHKSIDDRPPTIKKRKVSDVTASFTSWWRHKFRSRKFHLQTAGLQIEKRKVKAF